ncbi:diguanylate cyclase [Nisaea acidiphila]|uniref:Diguanylate cyclase n=1 Tax=Nisaea acidiphila TaxID=1862145 RepID=A0A9J7AYX0_9PROT|nr:diguanylate cyclase [Nisaea acidiphila]UUX51986.1 diguanylate cyclase [Nisaea acidiphila]
MTSLESGGGALPGEELAELAESDSERLMRLLEDGAPLFDYPGPVLLLDRDKKVVGANPGAMSLVHGIMSGTALSLTALVSATLSSGGRPQNMKILDEEAGRTTDITALPVDGGKHVLLFGRDISLDQNLRNALVESRQRYKDLVEISSDFAWETDASGKFVFVSTAGALGYEPDELVGHVADDFVEKLDGITIVTPFNAREPSTGIEFRFRRADGTVAELEASAAPLSSEDGEWLGARGVCRDVTEARRRDAALAKARNRERLMAYIVRTIRDELDPKAMLASAARAIARSLASDGCVICRRDARGKLAVAAELGTPPAVFLANVLASDAEGQAPTTVDDPDGTHVLSFPTDYHQAANGAVILWRDASGGAWNEDDADLMKEVSNQIGIAIEQVASHENLELLSTTDPLTKLLNRRTFQERLDGKLSKKGAGGALVYVDLDNFKLVNDNLGHKMGDKVLLDVAAMLHGCAGKDDMPARLGGDEFVVWFDTADRDKARAKAEHLLEAAGSLAQYAVDETRKVGMSIGIACIAPGGNASSENAENLIARADEAMYEIKHGGKNAYTFAPDPEVSGAGNDDD